MEIQGNNEGRTCTERQQGAIESRAAQLSRLTGLPFVALLTEYEASELAAHIINVASANYDLGFNDGVTAQTQYNDDMAQLVHAPPSIEH